MSESPLKSNRIVALDNLIPHPDNYRQHPDEQVQKLILSLQRFGQGRSIVIQDSPGKQLIVAGHGIVDAAKALKWPELRADILPADWTPEQVKGYLIADNQHAQGASDDDEMLARLLQEQQDAGIDLASLGADDEALRQMLESLGNEYLQGDEDTQEEDTSNHTSLAERFIIPPFSVLDARQGYWQERKRAWIALGIQSELGRGDLLTWTSEQVTEPGLNYYRNQNKMGGTPMPDGHGGLSDQLANHSKNGKGLARCYGQDLMRGEHVVGKTGKAQSGATAPDGMLIIDHYRGRGEKAKSTDSRLSMGWTAHAYDDGGPGGTISQSGTSIFDPVLCELAYRWFSPPDGVVLDPFAGGSVRGIVAAKTGRQYIGIDLRQEQVEANEAQTRAILHDEAFPQWIVGDSRNIDTLCADIQADLIFTCPPYYDLEVYSDNEHDLSTAFSYDDFLSGYRSILKHAIAKLKDNRFVCLVVGDIRDKKGFYRNFVSDTITACQDAGARLYNEAILVTSVGSLPIRVGKQFSSGRKLGKTHQNVLVFCKGNPIQAVKDCGPVVVEVPEDEAEEIEEEEETINV